LAFAKAAADAGLDGVFAYDHLWPMGAPTRPSLAPFAVLAAVAHRHENLSVAPLVARVGIVGTSHLVEQFRTLEALAPGRVIAALGTGDRLSMEENVAYGIAVRSADERRQLLKETAEALKDSMPVWFGGGAEATNRLARDLGVELNLWDSSPEHVKEMSADGPTNWAGPVPEELAMTLDALRDAGATWAVLSPQVEIAQLKDWRSANELSKFH
jgi:alkanesulfonate monooxygenase SsuD/methylene tetrahydromethanopterin reductase-like flavin-dependent oxidoreductase (luciferase family)